MNRQCDAAARCRRKPSFGLSSAPIFFSLENQSISWGRPTFRSGTSSFSIRTLHDPGKQVSLEGSGTSLLNISSFIYPARNGAP